MTCEDTVTAADENQETTLRICVDGSSAGMRLDHFLVRQLPEATRSKITASIRSGTFFVNGSPVKNSYKLKGGDVIGGGLESPPPLEVLPEKIDFPVLYEDDHLLFLSKPPGLVVHPGSGNLSGTLVNGLVYYCRAIAGVGDDLRPGIVHRLDKDTTGIMVAAKTESVHRQLVEAFKAREVKKDYIALVHGVVADQEGRIVAPIGRHSSNRQKMAVREHSGKYAVSNWTVLDVFDNRYTLLKVRIETGRTHQIRVHMAYMKHPVAGDVLYGSGRDNSSFPRQMLHAAKLVLTHPVTGRKMKFEAPLWQDFTEIIDGFSETGEGGS